MKAENEALNEHKNADRQRRGKLDLCGVDPRKPFFMAISVGNLDAVTDTEAEAIEAAKEVNDSYPALEVWIYRCVPIAKVWRGDVRVKKFK